MAELSQRTLQILDEVMTNEIRNFTDYLADPRMEGQEGLAVAQAEVDRLQPALDEVRAARIGAQFCVADVFVVTGRGPVITRSVEESRAAWNAGERWFTGDWAICGELRARVAGIERHLVPDAPDGALLLAIDPEKLEPGQIWVKEL